MKRGSNERQFNSPGIDLPMTSIFRSKYGEYPEYHTSLDNFNLVTIKGVKDGFKVACKAVNILLKKTFPQNLVLCEPQMSKRGIYPGISNYSNKKLNKITQKYMDFLQYTDGRNDLKDISNKIQTNLLLAKKIYITLKKNNLVR